MNARQWIGWSVLLVVGSMAMAAADAATDDATLSVGALTITRCPIAPNFGSITLSGYAPGVYGSYSPIGLTGGKSVAGIGDLTAQGGCIVGARSHLSVAGFTADPGTGWLTSVTCNETTRASGTAVYSYSSGTATWTWHTRTFGFTNGTLIGCSIVHN